MSDMTFLAKRLQESNHKLDTREMVYPNDDYFSTDYFEKSILIDEDEDEVEGEMD